MRPALKVGHGREESQALVLSWRPGWPCLPTAHPTSPLAPLLAPHPHWLQPCSALESQFTKGKMKRSWNVKCIIQLQPRCPTLPSRGAQVPLLSEMKVQAAGGGCGAGSHLWSLSFSCPSCLPALFLSVRPPLSPALSLGQIVQLAGSVSLLPTLLSNCLSHFWLLLFTWHLSNSLPLPLFPTLCLSSLLLLSLCLSFPLSSSSRSQPKYNLLQEALPDPPGLLISLCHIPRTFSFPSESYL